MSRGTLPASLVSLEGEKRRRKIQQAQAIEGSSARCPCERIYRCNCHCFSFWSRETITIQGPRPTAYLESQQLNRLLCHLPPHSHLRDGRLVVDTKGCIHSTRITIGKHFAPTAPGHRQVMYNHGAKHVDSLNKKSCGKKPSRPFHEVVHPLPPKRDLSICDVSHGS